MRKVFVPCILALTIASLIGPPGVWAEEFAWATRMGGVQYDDGIDIVVDGNGNSYVTGSFSGAADFGPYSLTSADSNDAFVAKLDNTGSVQWARRMGGSNISGGIGIAMDSMGNLYVIGVFTAVADFGPYNLTSVGSEDIFVAKLDNAGSVQWATRMGGPGLDYGVDIAVDVDGNAYVTGTFIGNADFGPYNLTSVGSEDIFVAKLDNTGTVQWAMRMGGANRDFGNGIAVDGDGDIYLTGSFSDVADFGSSSLTAAGSNDAFVTKLDNSGTVQWATRMGGISYDEGKGISLDRTGNIYVSGTFYDAAAFGPYHLTSKGEGDVFVTKLNKSGKVHWAVRMGSTGPDYAARIAIDGDGNAYVTGTFYGVSDFGPYLLTPVGSYDAFVTKLDRKGKIQWARRMGGLNNDYGLGIAVDLIRNTYVTGYFDPSADFGPYTLTSAGFSDIFVTKLTQ